MVSIVHHSLEEVSTDELLAEVERRKQAAEVLKENFFANLPKAQRAAFRGALYLAGICYALLAGWSLTSWVILALFPDNPPIVLTDTAIAFSIIFIALVALFSFVWRQCFKRKILQDFKVTYPEEYKLLE